MVLCRSCWSCCSFLLLLGFSQPVIIEIPQDSVNGTVGHSALLSVSYRLKEPFHQPLRIFWTFSCTTDALVAFTGNNCVVNAEGIPANCSASSYVHSAYRGRALLFHENASLLLQNLMLSDSGDYSVTVGAGQGKQIKYITLTVSEPQSNNGNADYGNQTTDHDVFYIAGGSSCFILLFLLLLFCFRWRRGMVQRKTRMIEQQEVMNPDDLHMESVLSRNLSTVYASVGEDIEQGQPDSELRTEYASIRFPHYQ